MDKHDDEKVSDTLQRYYQAQAQENEQSLQRVQQRLAQHEAQQKLQQTPISLQDYQKLKQGKAHMQEQKRNKGKHLLALVASIIVAVGLVSSAVYMFGLLNNKTTPPTSTQKPSATATKEVKEIVNASGIYIHSFEEADAKSKITKLDLKNRQELWTVSLDQIGGGGGFVVYGDTIYTTISNQNHENFVLAVSTQDGTIRWKKSTGVAIQKYTQKGPGDKTYETTYDIGSLTTPTVTLDTVYVTAGNGKLYALESETGKERWIYNIGKNVIIEDEVKLSDGTVAVNTTRTSAEPVTVKDNVVYGALRNKAYTVDAKTGNELWSQEIDKYQLFTQPVLGEKSIYIASYETSHHRSDASQTGMVHALNPNNGSIKWKFSTDRWVRMPPVVTKDTVYFGSHDHFVYALDASNGTQKWKYDTGGQVFSSPFVDGDVIYAAQTGVQEIGPGERLQPTIIALNAKTGEKLWHIDTNYDLQAVHDGLIYTSSYPGKVTILDQTGKSVWDKQISGAGGIPYVVVIP